MKSNFFPENYEFGVKKYRHVLDAFYRYYCYDGRFVSIGSREKSTISDVLQRNLKTDILIQKGDMASYGVEEKVVSWPGYPYTAFFLETDSCTNIGRESPGWMLTCQADLLLYAFEIQDVGLLIYLFAFPILKQWFWKSYLPYVSSPDTGLSIMREHNRSAGRLVPIRAVTSAVPTRCFAVFFNGKCRAVKPETMPAHLHHFQGTPPPQPESEK